jgi:hypothetical protein
MDDPIDKYDSHEKPSKRTSRLAIASATLVPFPLLLLEFWGEGSTVRMALIVLPWLLSIVMGVLALLLIIHKRRVLRGAIFAVVGVSLSTYFVALPYLNQKAYLPMCEKGACEERIMTLFRALERYGSENEEQLPNASKWCDLLVEKCNISAESFLCPKLDTANSPSSSYAMNEHIVEMKLGEIPKDTVILFETNPAWNAVGTDELLNFENHSYWWEITSSGILLADGTVIFVQSKDRDILRWKP